MPKPNFAASNGATIYEVDYKQISPQELFSKGVKLKSEVLIDVNYSTEMKKKNMYVCFSKNKLKKDLVYKEYPFETVSNYVNEIVLTTHDVEDVFSFEEDDSGRPCIKVSINNFDKETTKSIQYWFLDNGSLKFVFGVNTPDKELEQDEYSQVWEKDKYMKIYLSMVTARNTNVFDENHRKVGNMLNMLDYELPSYASSGQYYGIPNVPQYSILLDYPIENYSLEITRVKSPYGNKPENQVISINDKLYYGDVIKINAILNEGYYFDDFLVNGETYTNEKQITIREDLKISFNVYYPSWHIKQTFVYDAYEDWKPEVYFDAPLSESVPVQYVTTTEEVNEKTQKIRITGTFVYYDNGQTKNVDFTNLELNFSRANPHAVILYYGGYDTNLYVDMVRSGNNHYMFATENNIISSLYGISLSITKFEEYY